MKLNFNLLFAVLSMTSVVMTPIAAQSQSSERSPELSSKSSAEQRALYQLCSRSPFNSRCAGLNIPVVLDVRLGEQSSCVLRLGNRLEQGDCKLNPTDTGLTLYMETGEPVELLERKRGTIEVKIPNNRIFSLNSQNWVKTYRFELGYAHTENGSKNQTAFLEILGDNELNAWLTPKLNVQPLSPEKFPTMTATGDVAASVKQLLETKECVGCNLAGADLQGAKLSEANLEGANLQGANLQGAKLERAYLVGANLDQANLSQARLTYANLTLSSLQETLLQEAELTAVNLQGATAQGANFTEAKMVAPAMLQGINLSNANLQNANLQGAMLANANLDSANLQGADLSDIRVNSSGLVDRYTFAEAALSYFALGALGVALGAMNQQGVPFSTNLQGANLSNANLTGANLEDVLLQNANFSNATLKDAQVEDTDFAGANLCGAVMVGGDRATQGCP